MSEVRTWECNVCKALKKDVNHWFHAHLVDGGVLILPWEQEGAIATIATADAHLCGMEHAMQWAGKELVKPRKQEAHGTL